MNKKGNCQGDQIIFSIGSKGNNRADRKDKTKSLKNKIDRFFLTFLINKELIF